MAEIESGVTEREPEYQAEWLKRNQEHKKELEEIRKKRNAYFAALKKEQKEQK